LCKGKYFLKKKFMYRAVAKKTILAQEMGKKKFWQAKNPPPLPSLF